MAPILTRLRRERWTPERVFPSAGMRYLPPILIEGCRLQTIAKNGKMKNNVNIS
jgi:hypothetical protein